MLPLNWFILMQFETSFKTFESNVCNLCHPSFFSVARQQHSWNMYKGYGCAYNIKYNLPFMSNIVWIMNTVLATNLPTEEPNLNFYGIGKTLHRVYTLYLFGLVWLFHYIWIKVMMMMMMMMMMIMMIMVMMCHHIERLHALLAIYEGNAPGIFGYIKYIWLCFPHCWPFVWGNHWLLVDSQHKGPVMLTCHGFFIVHLYKLLNKQLSGIWNKKSPMWWQSFGI